MKCTICGKEFTEFGNNPWPVRTSEEARCCDRCNSDYVIPFRLITMGSGSSRIEAVARILNTMDTKALDTTLSDVDFIK